jgi:hypothetical protein
MSAAPRKPVISVTMDEEDRDIFSAEAQRTGEHLTTMMLRLAKLGLEHQRQAEAGGMVVGDGDAVADKPLVPLLPAATAGTVASTSSDIVLVTPAAVAVSPPTPALLAVDEPTVTGAPASHGVRARRKRPWSPTAAGEPPVGSVKARWTAVGLLSAMLAVMLVPGNGAGAAAISKVALGEPSDGIAASNLLFERYSQRAGPLRHWNATNRLAGNDGRVKSCADRADRFADYRRLTRCEILVSSRKRAIEVGQGIVD